MLETTPWLLYLISITHTQHTQNTHTNTHTHNAPQHVGQCSVVRGHISENDMNLWYYLLIATTHIQ